QKPSNPLTQINADTERGFKLSGLAEDQYVPVRILHFKLPVAIRLLPKRLHNRRFLLHRLKKIPHSLDAKVSVPHTAASRSVKIRLFVTFNALQHDLDVVSIHDCEDVWFGGGKGIADKAELFFIPTDGRANVGYRKTRRCRMKFCHRLRLLMLSLI